MTSLGLMIVGTRLRTVLLVEVIVNVDLICYIPIDRHIVVRSLASQMLLLIGKRLGRPC